MSDDCHEYDEEVFATIGDIHESMVLDDPLYKKGYQAGAAYRDAEIAELVAALVKAADFIQPYNSARDLLEELDAALAKVRKP